MSVFMKRDKYLSKPLPYDKIDYIESSGTQYIDTEYKLNNNTRIEMEISFADTTTTQFFFGSRNTGSYGDMSVFYQKSTKKICADYSANNQRHSFSVDITGRLTIDFNKNKLIINGEQYTFTASTFQSTRNLILLGINNAGNIISLTKGRLYKCKIYDNEKLLYDYIPVRMKNSGEIGLWNKIENKFYGNAGTGSFAWYKSDIPSKYEVLNYIQSTGMQYIDTEYFVNNTTKIVMDAQLDNYTDLTPQPAYFYCNDGTYEYGVLDASISRNWIYFYYHKTYAGYWNTAPVDTRRTIVVDGNKATLDSITITGTANTYKMTKSLYLLAGNEEGTVMFWATGKLFSCQIYDNNICVRDYVPVKRRHTNIIGLWDKINNVFYPNKGSGAFIGG